MKNNNKELSVNNFNKNQYIFAIFFGLIITIPLLFKGLFFEKEQLPYLTFIDILFITWLVYNTKTNKNFKLMSSSIDYIVFGIVIMYLLSILYGVNKRESILEFGRHLSYFIIYLFAKKFDENNKYTRTILTILLIGGILIVTIGIGTAAGTWNFPDAMLGDRLSGTFQYPNTFASYVTVLYILSLTLLIDEKISILKLLYGSLMGVYLFSLILSYSRAMWLIFPIVIALFFVILPNKRKLESLLYVLISVAIAFPSAFIFNKILENPNIKLWVIFLASGIFTGAITLFISKFADKFRNISIKGLLIFLAIIILLSSILLVYAINATTELVLENLTNEDQMTSVVRYTSITTPEINYTLKVHYISYNDSESPYSGLIRIYNVDNKGELEQLASQVIVNSEESTLEIPFTTLENSAGIRILFSNYYSNTKIIIKEIAIYETHSSQLIKNIPLKYKYISESLINRIQTIGVGENSVTARIIYNKDGFKLVSQSPIFGVGGGGWLSLYQKYQSYSYWTTLAHNFILQMWIEIGTIGLLLFVLMIVLLLIYTFRYFRNTDNISNKILISGLVIVIFSMILHGVVDFDMSFPAYSIIFWTILGLLVKQINILDMENKISNKLNMINPKLFSYIIIVMSFVTVYNFASITYSNKYKKLAIEASQNNDLNSIITNFEKVIKYDKYEPSYKIDLTNAYIEKYRETNDTEYVRKAIEQSNKYIELSSYDPNAYALLASFNLSIGEIEKGLDLLEKSIELCPMRVEAYINKINGYKSVIDYYLSIGENEVAKDYLIKALNVKEDIKNINNIILKPWNVNVDLIKSIGELEYLYKNIDSYLLKAIQGLKLHFAYYFDLDTNNDGDLDMLDTTKPEGSQIKHEVLLEDNDSHIRITNVGEVLGFKLITPINLQPNTTYVVELKARGTTKPETFNLYAWSVGATEPKQGELISIELYNDWKTYSFEFTTDPDIEPGRQYIRIQHNGKDTGYIDIKDLVIFSK